MAAMQASLPVKAFRVLFQGDQEMIDETLGQFSYNVPMDRNALLFGAGFAFALLLSLEGLLALARSITRKSLSQHKAQ
jgi:hypothetical protein